MRFFRKGPRVDVVGLSKEVAAQLTKLVDDVDDSPRDLRCRRALADFQRELGRTNEAIASYQALAGAYAAQGLLFRAIAVCKTILELDADHDETEATLAALYAQHDVQSDRALVELPASMGAALAVSDDEIIEDISIDAVGEDARSDDDVSVLDAPPLPSDERSIDDLAPVTGSSGADDDIADDGIADDVEIEIDADEIVDDDILASLTPRGAGSVQLQRPEAVPLFSGLSPARFTELVKALRCWEAEPGAVIVVEGEPGDSVFVIARGAVVIERAGADGPIELARLRAGEFFGEIAILAERPRAASVTALKKTELLEVDRATLAALVARDPDVAGVLEDFCTRRLIENTIQSSPLFDGLDTAAVLMAMQRFEARVVVDGDTLVAQGSASSGLHILLSGVVDVIASADVAGLTSTIRLKRLGPGDVFGEMGLLHGEPATASCVAHGPARLAVLSADAWAGLQGEHPELRRRLEALNDARAAFNARFLPADDTSGARRAAL